jgi:hypothetical protein
LIRRDLREEAGYSLVEVMFSIMLLTIALLPMIGMFDMGIKSATSSGNYDKARTLANLKMEEAKSLPFNTLRDNFPVAPATTPYDDGPGHYQSPDWIDTDQAEAGRPASAEFANFDYMIDKQYMRQPDHTVDDPSGDFQECDPTSIEPAIACDPGTNLIRVTVTVRWLADDGVTYNTYTTYGLVAA